MDISPSLGIKGRDRTRNVAHVIWSLWIRPHALDICAHGCCGTSLRDSWEFVPADYEPVCKTCVRIAAAKRGDV
jgi:hypothetical protein